MIVFFFSFSIGLQSRFTPSLHFVSLGALSIATTAVVAVHPRLQQHPAALRLKPVLLAAGRSDAWL